MDLYLSCVINEGQFLIWPPRGHLTTCTCTCTAFLTSSSRVWDLLLHSLLSWYQMKLPVVCVCYLKVSCCEKFGYGVMVTQVAAVGPGVAALCSSGTNALSHTHTHTLQCSSALMLQRFYSRLFCLVSLKQTDKLRRKKQQEAASVVFL